MANYEFMAILNPDLSEDERQKVMDEIKELLSTNGAKIEKEDIWWEKKLAYKINRTERGFYILYDLELDGQAIKPITSKLNINKGNIWRFMFVKKDS